MICEQALHHRFKNREVAPQPLAESALPSYLDRRVGAGRRGAGRVGAGRVGEGRREATRAAVRPRGAAAGRASRSSPRASRTTSSTPATSTTTLTRSPCPRTWTSPARARRLALKRSSRSPTSSTSPPGSGYAQILEAPGAAEALSTSSRGPHCRRRGASGVAPDRREADVDHGPRTRCGAAMRAWAACEVPRTRRSTLRRCPGIWAVGRRAGEGAAFWTRRRPSSRGAGLRSANASSGLSVPYSLLETRGADGGHGSPTPVGARAGLAAPRVASAGCPSSASSARRARS